MNGRMIRKRIDVKLHPEQEMVVGTENFGTTEGHSNKAVVAIKTLLCNKKRPEEQKQFLGDIIQFLGLNQVDASGNHCMIFEFMADETLYSHLEKYFYSSTRKDRLEFSLSIFDGLRHLHGLSTDSHSDQLLIYRGIADPGLSNIIVHLESIPHNRGNIACTDPLLFTKLSQNHKKRPTAKLPWKVPTTSNIDGFQLSAPRDKMAFEKS
ncbi:5900_t:CDS:2 [Paraglomus occultum]|uniref:5900_t:CDS:1 n=1 Tax=Paraglomus occultum TaxID=144539 RepID=A0A9N9BY76_9GLOM|nr:5900_t:CDS:2 [Paraglomus occultum]